MSEIDLTNLEVSQVTYFLVKEREMIFPFGCLHVNENDTRHRFGINERKGILFGSFFRIKI